MKRHLFVPGLLGPVPLGVDNGDPSLPRLEMLLARADRRHEPVGLERSLFALFGIACPADADLPTAALCYLADAGEPPDGFVLHADPVELVPDRDSLIAFGFDRDPLDADERVALVDSFNSYFGDDGLRLIAVDAGRLYLHCAEAPSIRTHPLSTVMGRAIDPYLPDGDDRRRWRGLSNEVQMLCHAHEINRDRETQGRPMLAGLWFSGGGRLPVSGKNPFGRVLGADPLIQGLIRHSISTGDDELVFEPTPWRALLNADVQAWRAAITAVDVRLEQDLVDGLALLLHPGNGQVFHWRSGFTRRWWRRRRSFRHYLDQAREAAGQRL